MSISEVSQIIILPEQSVKSGKAYKDLLGVRGVSYAQPRNFLGFSLTSLKGVGKHSCHILCLSWLRFVAVPDLNSTTLIQILDAKGAKIYHSV